MADDLAECARCDWAGDDLAGHAEQARHPLCRVCGRSLTLEENGACSGCVNRARLLLLDVETAYTLLPDQLGAVSGQLLDVGRRVGDDTPLPGSDALVLLAPGNAGSSASVHKPGTVLHGNREHVVDNYESDPPSVAALLAAVEDDWRHLRGEPAAAGPPMVSSSVAYLSSRMTWAAGLHPEFGEFLSELRQLHGRVTTVTGTSDRPVHSTAECLSCGQAALIRRWTAEGLSDQWRCAACHRVYGTGEYWLALRQRMERDQAS